MFNLSRSTVSQLISNRWFQACCFLALVILVRFWPMFLEGKTLYFADNYSLMMPGKVFTAQWLRQGVLPMWNPYLLAGIPWIGDVNQSVLSPATLPFIWLSPATALNVVVITHVGIAFIGMYLLSWRWTKHQLGSVVAGVLWACSTHISGSINNLATLQSIVWIPWLIWLGLQIGRERRAPIWFAIVVWLQFAGGYPQHVLYGILMAVLFSLYVWWSVRVGRPPGWWPWWRDWSLTAGMSLALSAVIWLPFIDVLFHSTRMLQTSAQAAVGSLDVKMLIKLVVPYFYDKSVAGMKWGPAWSGQPNAVFYVTWVGLGFIGTVFTSAKTRIKDDWFFGLFCLVTLLFAMGEKIPGFGLLQQFIPLFRVSRNPSMILMLTNLTLALWVASAWSRLKLQTNWLRLAGWVISASLIGSLVAWALVHWQFAPIWHMADQILQGRLSSGQFHTLARDQVIAQVITESWFVASGLTLGALWAMRKKRWVLVALCVSFDIIYHTQAMFFFGPASIYPVANQVTPVTSMVAPDPSYRWLTRNSNTPYTDYGSYWEAMVVRAPFSDSFVDWRELTTTTHAQRLRDGLTPDWNAVYGIPTIHGYTTLVPQNFAALWETDSETSINFIDQIKIENKLLRQWAVRYYLVDTWFTIAETLPGVPLNTYEQWQLYELPALSRFRLADDSAVTIQNLNETPNRIELSFDNPHNSPTLTIADRYDRDWVGSVNGQAVTIQNHQEMRQLAIQPGTNKVVLSYEPNYFWTGLAISILASGVGIAWFLLLSRRD